MYLAAGVGRRGGCRRIAQLVAHFHTRQGAVLGQHGAERSLDRLAAIIDRLGQVQDQAQRLFLRPTDLEIGGLVMPGLIVYEDLVGPFGHFHRQEKVPRKRARGR